MNTKHILIAALLAGAFAPALAQADDAEPAVHFHFETVTSGNAEDNGGPGEAAVQRFEVRRGAQMPGVDHVRLAGPLMGMHGRAIKNAPYSAEVISEQQQNLPDGNQIVNKTSSVTYRDSAGRTRTESRDASGNVRAITINDAAEGITYILRPEAKTATKIGPRGDIARMAADKARVAADRVRIAGDDMRKDSERERIIVKRIERAEGEAAHRVAENVRIHVARELDGKLAGLNRLEGLNPMIAGAFGDAKWAARATTKDLGSKEIEGVKANGKLRSYEIPAGEIGNRNPIVVSTEIWYSPELHVTLLSKRSDPRIGDRIYRVAGIKREEPAAALFTVPADYTVKDVMAELKKREKKK